MTANKIPFAATNYFSKMAVDYINQEERLKPFIQQFPSQVSLQQQIKIKESSYDAGGVQADRDLLRQVLLRQYADIVLNDAVRTNIESLSQPQTFTICTAHQPCIFTGPLYFIYKITHGIALAQECKRLFPEYHFVPLYYMGSEDNDIDEIGTVFLGEEKLKWETLQTGACGRMNTTDLESVTRKVLSLLNENEADEKWLSAIIQNAFLSGKSLSEATRILVNALFEHTGLVVLDGDDASFKKVFAPVMEDELFSQHSSRLVHETAAEIAQHYKVQASGRDINLFYLKDDIRERIERKEDQWLVHNTDISFSETALRQELELHPERFSPNVILRPLYQEMLLPNIAFLGGGGELAYWLELKKIFEHYRVVYPLIFLRNSFVLIEKKLQHVIEKLGLHDAELFLPAEKLYRRLLADNDHLTALDIKLAELENIYMQIEDAGAEISINLSGSMKAHHAKANRISDRIRQKYLSHIKRSESDKLMLADKMKQSLFPAGSLQERHDNFIPYFKKYGRQWIDDLIEIQGDLQSMFIVVKEG